MDFLKSLADSSPAPAGGAAAAYSLGLALGLIYKTVLTECKRNGSSELYKNLRTVKKGLEKLAADAEKLVKEDSELYINFVNSLRGDDQGEMKRCFSRITDVSVKTLEKSDAAFEWIRQLQPLVPRKMHTHLRVACELLTAARNSTAYILKDHIQYIRSLEKRENYLKRLNETLDEYQKRHWHIIENIA